MRMHYLLGEEMKIETQKIENLTQDSNQETRKCWGVSYVIRREIKKKIAQIKKIDRDKDNELTSV